MIDRRQVYEAIDGEREYQNAQKGNAARHFGYPDNIHPGEYLTYIRKLLSDAEHACYKGNSGAEDCLPYFRKIASLCVSCMELYGAPKRACCGS